MKKLTFSLVAALAVAGTCFAGTTYSSAGKEYKEYKETPVETYCFNAQELSLDIFGSYVTDVEDNDAYYGSGGGGGVGLNYFFHRYLGLGVDANWSPTGEPDDTVIHEVSGSFIARFPIDSICLAPYIFAGGGAKFNGDNEGTLHGGAGLEFRVTEKIGIFADGRYTFLGEDKNDTVLVRGGLRFVF
jgi:opacity protein-like surface antigen